MSYMRVNLLHKNEQRFQGAVSRRFMLASLIVTPLLLLAVLGSVQFIHYQWLKSNLFTTQEIWKNLQPRLELHQEEIRGLAANEKAMKLCDGWNESRVELVPLLEEIRACVPDNIQFTRLSMHSPVEASVVAASEELQLDYRLTLEGLAQGEHAENQVIDFRKMLLTRDQLLSTFDSVNLVSLRKRLSGTGSVMREFRLVGRGAEGGQE